MLPVTPSEPRRSNTGMIYVPCPSLHTACSPALELLVKPNCSSNLSPYMCGRWGAKVREMKMTRLDLIVVSICGSRQDVCLNVYLSICPSVSLASWRRVLSQWVETLWLQAAIMGTDLIQQEYRVHWRDLSRPDSIIITTHRLMEKYPLVSVALINGIPDLKTHKAPYKTSQCLMSTIKSSLYLYIFCETNYANVSDMTLRYLFASNFLTSLAHLTRLSQ